LNLVILMKLLYKIYFSSIDIRSNYSEDISYQALLTLIIE
jgi:hypothetical protein